MLAVFISSGLVLVLLWGMKYMEAATNTVIVRRVTQVSDRTLALLYRTLRQAVIGLVETLRRDVLLKALHAITYVLLVMVREIEVRLERFTAFVRRARRGVRRGPPAHLPGTQEDGKAQ